jgi:hypothetical protein
MMEREDEILGMICPECYWEHDDIDSEYGPNSVSLDEARANWRLYGACDPHGYWCKHYKELPRGVAEGERKSVIVWLILTSCPECHARTAPGGDCPECGYSD